MLFLTSKKVHHRCTQIRDPSVDKREGTYVLNYTELPRHGGAIMAEGPP